ncbi:hypothetical protein IAQ61_002395, partial [Plenodomus lingam]|uniref:Predicted protein n=1 Tax=Leptosphaeria maculans (strain JN3 / isolate v23.1.3 / race Av1-4-5-6-7-8) TaxID=985895 RepID=E4ZHU2_LEPMJ
MVESVVSVEQGDCGGTRTVKAAVKRQSVGALTPGLNEATTAGHQHMPVLITAYPPGALFRSSRGV